MPNNRILVSKAAQALEQMKYEIANEFGIELGADTSARDNGTVGGEIVKRLVSIAQQEMKR